MKKYYKRVQALCVMGFLLLPALGSAKLFYTPSQYNKVYNEKVAAELEVKGARRKFNNEKSRLEDEIKKLNSRIKNLEERLKYQKNMRARDKKFADNRVKELEKTIAILQKKSGSREQQLVEENKKIQARYEKQIALLKSDLEKERAVNIKKLADLRSSYDSQVSQLNKQVKNLNAELAVLKKLSKSQKEELSRMKRQADELEKRLKKEIKLGQIRLKRFHDRLVINIDDKISFDSGSAKLKKGILPALKTIAQILVNFPENRIVVEGHTDNVPIRTSRFQDNWKLSTERALSVLRYLLRNKKLSKSRFSAAGYGEHNPIVSNKSAKNRSLNRRVDLVVIPRSGK